MRRALGLRFRAEMRGGWPAWAALALVIGLVGGAALTAAGGARRTDTAFGRLEASHAAAQILVSPQGTALTGFGAAVARVPGVLAAGIVTLNAIRPLASGGASDAGTYAAVSVDGSFTTAVERPKIVAGRLFDPNVATDAVIDRDMARSRHLHPGSALTVVASPVAQGEPDVQRSQELSLRVVGVAVFDNKVVPIAPSDNQSVILLGPAFFRLYGTKFQNADGVFVRLAPGTDLAQIHRRIGALASQYPDTGGSVYFADLAQQHAAVQRAVRPEASALALFAVLLAAVGLAVTGQLLSRQVALDAREHPTLAALGIDRRSLMVISLLPTALIGAAAAVVALTAAVLASPLMPIGPARLAEPHPGFGANLAILLPGAAAIAALTVLVAVPAAWRAARSAAASDSPVRLATAEAPNALGAAVSALTGANVACSVGVRMALQPGRGRNAVPVRSAVVGTTIALAAMTAALTFGSSLGRLVNTPHRFGQTWDLQFDTQFGAVPRTAVAAVVATVRSSVSEYSAGAYAEMTIAGRLVAGIGVDAVDGSVFPTLLSGQAPSGPDQVVLGAATMREVGVRVGDTVDVTVAGVRRPMHVSGEAVLPAFGQGNFTPTDLGHGAITVGSGVAPPSRFGPGPGFNFILIRLRPGADIHATTVRLLDAAREIGCPPGACRVRSVQLPGDISTYKRVQTTPLVLALTLAVLGVATLAHVLLTSIRRRRRDLAVLKTLGFSRSQVSISVAWQSSTLALVSLAVGLPVGLVAGSRAWSAFAGSLGVARDPALPLLPILVAVPVTLLLANAIAAIPGWIAARSEPAAVLRSE